MANIRKIEGKSGTSYKITVTMGRDSSGKQIRHYKTWKPDRPMTARQIEKEVQRVAAEFERQIEIGFVADDRQTFEAYSKYVLELKAQAGTAESTIRIYEAALKMCYPIIGHMRLADIRPQHLNNLYATLKEPGCRRDKIREIPCFDLSAVLKESGETTKGFASRCGLNEITIRKIKRGQGVTTPTAERVSEILGKRKDELFKTTGDGEKLSTTAIRKAHETIAVILGQAEKEMLITYKAAIGKFTYQTYAQLLQHHVSGRNFETLAAAFSIGYQAGKKEGAK